MIIGAMIFLVGLLVGGVTGFVMGCVMAVAGLRKGGEP